MPPKKKSGGKGKKQLKKKPNPAATTTEAKPEKPKAASPLLYQARSFIKNGKPEVLERLLTEHQNLLSEAIPTGDTLLHYACSVWQYQLKQSILDSSHLPPFQKMITMLLTKGANPKAENAARQTPLMILYLKNGTVSILHREYNEAVIQAVMQALEDDVMKMERGPNEAAIATIDSHGRHEVKITLRENVQEAFSEAAKQNKDSEQPILVKTADVRGGIAHSQVRVAAEKIEASFGVSCRIESLSGQFTAISEGNVDTPVQRGNSPYDYLVEVTITCSTKIHTILTKQAKKLSGISIVYNTETGELTAKQLIGHQSPEQCLAPLTALLETRKAEQEKIQKKREAKKQAREAATPSFERLLEETKGLSLFSLEKRPSTQQKKGCSPTDLSCTP